MPAVPLPEALETWLQAARPAVMASVRSDDAPVTVPCWYEYRPGGRVLLSMSDTARRLGHLRQNPRVAMTVLGNDWYQHVSLIGRVIETRPDEDLADLDRLSNRYEGVPYPDREPTVTVIVEVERWHTFGNPAAGTPSPDAGSPGTPSLPGVP